MLDMPQESVIRSACMRPSIRARHMSHVTAVKRAVSLAFCHYDMIPVDAMPQKVSEVSRSACFLQIADFPPLVPKREFAQHASQPATGVFDYLVPDTSHTLAGPAALRRRMHPTMRAASSQIVACS